MRNDGFVPSIKGRIGGLDELRGLAIFFVMAAHLEWMFPEAQSILKAFGPVGVNLFFVISGYLIATILLQTRQQPDYFRTFWIRRVFRILPLSYVMITVGLLATLMIGRSLIGVPYYLTFTQNFIPETPNLLPTDPNWTGPFVGLNPMWSLAVEEQFYVVLPLLVRFVRPQWFPVTILGMSLGSLILLYTAYPEWQYELYYSNVFFTWCRLFYFGIGILLIRQKYFKFLTALFIAWAGIVVVNLATSRPFSLLELPIALMFAGVLYLAIHRGLYLKNRFLAYTGKLCFGLYLVHYPIAIGIKKSGYDLTDMSDKALAVGLYVVLSYVIAILSFYYFERPIQNQRYRLEKWSRPAVLMPGD